MSEEETITIKEFKMWLRGVEEMQPDDWTPDHRQWSRIRDRIDNIIESAPVPVVANTQPAFREEYQPPRAAPVMAQAGMRSVTPQPPSNAAMFGNADNPLTPTKTPNVDTSNGKPYEPAFI